MASGDAHQSLRLRRKGSHDADTAPPAQDEVRPRKTEEVVWGKTPSGEGPHPCQRSSLIVLTSVRE